MVIVGPGYLNHKSLPYASDIFYHKRLIYFLPTGFLPVELRSVLEFPGYCHNNSIALPGIIWEMCKLYFENSKDTRESLDIIEPLRKEFIGIAISGYPRNRIAIDKTKRLLAEHPSLYETFKKTGVDLQFAASELLSHVLFEVFHEEGYKPAIEYLRANSKNPDDFLLLVAATLINRLKLFASYSSTLLIYQHQHSWYPLINQLVALHNAGQSRDMDIDRSDSFIVEHFRFKLFETILMPIFGRCDTQSKNRVVARIANKKRKEIDVLKEECRLIASDVVLLPTRDKKLTQARLSDMISKHVAEPLSALIEKPLKDIKGLLKNFIIGSTVGGLVSILQSTDASLLATTVATGAISTGVAYILRGESHKQVQPTELLVTGIRKMKVKYDEIQKQLNSISIEQISLPREW